MALVSELELPAFDLTEQTLRGERFHEAMRQLRAQGWLARNPYGYVVLDRESGEFFLRPRQVVRCEFVEQFAKPYPSLVIASVMGAPLNDAPRLHHWSNWIQRQFDAVSMVNERAGIEQAVEEFYEYAEALVRARRSDPRDDLISKLIAAEEEGDRLSDVECINL